MKLLGDGDESDLVLVEDLHDAGKIEEGATEAVDFVDEYDIDLAGDNVLQESLQRGPVQVAAAKAAVIVALGQTDPALVLLAGKVRLCGFPLCIERVEFLLQAFLGGLAGVHGTAHGLGGRNAVVERIHEATPLGTRRKKR